MRIARRNVVMALFAVAASAACSSSSGDAAPAFRCQVSTAKSGGQCQVNFFCDGGGDGPAAYCSSDGSCACGAAADKPKEFTSADICTKDMNTMASIANRECGFGM